MHVWPGCENRKGKGGVASPIDFLCKIVCDMPLFKETLQDVGTLMILYK